MSTVCPSGKVYLECGTDCPDTCENKDEEIRICNLRCVQGNSAVSISMPGCPCRPCMHNNIIAKPSLIPRCIPSFSTSHEYTALKARNEALANSVL